MRKLVAGPTLYICDECVQTCVELGAFGAPHALAWNLIGFIVPGLLLAACGARLATAIDPSPCGTTLRWLLLIFGLGFAGTGVRRYRFAKSLLDRGAIDYMVKGETLNNVLGWAPVGWINSAREPAELWVRSEDSERTRSLR